MAQTQFLDQKRTGDKNVVLCAKSDEQGCDMHSFNQEWTRIRMQEVSLSCMPVLHATNNVCGPLILHFV